jgi:GWxTD domain-containing protein
VTVHAGRCAALLLLAVLAACGGSTPPSGEQLSNVRLGPEYSQWLVGPIVRMSSREEVDAYLALSDDATAAAFIEAYWARRGEAARRLFEARAAETDVRFAEAGYAGRRTDRGTIYILHGPPDRAAFEAPEFIDEPPLEVWYYEGSTRGLGGKPPAGAYRFAKQGELTRFYQQRVRRRNEFDPIR